jgi:hypothetical protein
MQQQQLTFDLTVGPLPVAPKQEVYALVVKWLDSVQVGRKFGPFEIQSHIIAVTGGKKRPQDGTITRYIRKYNEQGGHIENISRSRSTYVKTEERKVNRC